MATAQIAAAAPRARTDFSQTPRPCKRKKARPLLCRIRIVPSRLSILRPGRPRRRWSGGAEPEPTTIPSISITHPSQEKLPEPAREPKPILKVPGMFPEDESDSSGNGHQGSEGPSAAMAAAELAQNLSTPLRQATFEPVTQEQDAAHTPLTPGTVLATHPPPTLLEESEEESGSSIYSDAYEDLSDMEGDGFLSLDAVVESPIATSVSKSPFGSSSSTPQQPKPLSPQAPSSSGAIPAAAPAPVASGVQGMLRPKVDDWEKAKAYWRSLTADKRAQLEQEAMEDAAGDADREETKSPRPRKKKSAEKRAAEKKAIKEIQVDPERTYMIKPGTKVEADIVPAPGTAMRTSLRGGSSRRHGRRPSSSNKDSACASRCEAVRDQLTCRSTWRSRWWCRPRFPDLLGPCPSPLPAQRPRGSMLGPCRTDHRLSRRPKRRPTCPRLCDARAQTRARPASSVLVLTRAGASAFAGLSGSFPLRL